MKFDVLNDDMIAATTNYLEGIKKTVELLKDFKYCREQLLKYAKYSVGQHCMIATTFPKAEGWRFLIEKGYLKVNDVVTVEHIEHFHGEFQYQCKLHNVDESHKDYLFNFSESSLKLE